MHGLSLRQCQGNKVVVRREKHRYRETGHSRSQYTLAYDSDKWKTTDLRLCTTEGIAAEYR